MINLPSQPIKSSEYDDFKDLCRDMHDFVLRNAPVTMFNLRAEFSYVPFSFFSAAIDALVDDKCLLNDSKGFTAATKPQFSNGMAESSFESKDTFPPVSETPPSDRHLDRIDYIRDLDRRVLKVLSNGHYYSPACVVENAIASMNKGTTKTILDAFFIQQVDFDVLVKKYKNDVEKTLTKFLRDFPIDEIDMGLFNTYNLSSNVYMYVFNRSEAYYRLSFSSMDPGFKDVSFLFFPVESEGICRIHRTPGSEDMLDLPERVRTYIHNYMLAHGKSFGSFTNAYLGLLNNISVRKSLIKNLSRNFLLDSSGRFPSEDKWESFFNYFIEVDGWVKELTYDNIDAVCTILKGIKELDYGISVEKIFKNKSYGPKLRDHYIESVEELQDFILKYTPYQIYKGRVLVRGTLREAIENYVRDIQVYDPNRLEKLYSRSCGGPSKLIEPILKSINMELFINESPLTSEEKQMLSSRLADMEWLTRDNAKSIFADLHDLEDKFTEMNMHELGFTSLLDVYYRSKYQSFSECLLKNEFVGDEVYVDDRIFKLKMEGRAFSMEVEKLERYLHWIPVSNYRYLNLDSPRYKALSKIIREYRDRVLALCKKQFVTPFSLKNMHIGIPEIDDDDYGLEFYDAILIATKANHQTLSHYRFYYMPTYSSMFTPTAPDFIRFLVYNNNGSASIAELQVILQTEYGINAELPAIRAQSKSSCVYSEDTDSAYLDDDIYLEALRNESD